MDKALAINVSAIRAGKTFDGRISRPVYVHAHIQNRQSFSFHSACGHYGALSTGISDRALSIKEDPRFSRSMEGPTGLRISACAVLFCSWKWGSHRRRTRRKQTE